MDSAFSAAAMNLFINIPSKLRLRVRQIVSVLLFLASSQTSLWSQSNVGSATNPDYVLALLDTVSVAVVGEPELAAVELIDREGEIRLSLVGSIKLVNLTVRDAELVIAKAFKDQEFLRRPEVRVQVIEYAPRFATVFGAVRNPGKISFPRDRLQLEILDAVAQAGGITPVGKGDAVTLTRVNPDGTESVTTVDVSNLMSGKRKDAKAINLVVRPGDRLYVPERLF